MNLNEIQKVREILINLYITLKIRKPNEVINIFIIKKIR